MFAVKSNKEYTIAPEQADEYAAQGFDIYDGGTLVRHAANKTVPIAKYEAALREIDALKKQVADLKRQPARSARAKKAE